MSFRHLLWGLLLLFCTSCGPSPSNQETAKNPPDDAVATTGSAPTTPELVDSAFQIIPGQRIGLISVGEHPKAISDVLGEPDAANAAMGKSISTWYSNSQGGQRYELNVYTVTKKTGTPQQTVGVEQVRVTSPEFTLPENGLSVGSSLSQIRTFFPEATVIAHFPAHRSNLTYIYDAPAQGIAFEVTGADSTSVAITIHPPGSGALTTYLPIHPDLVQLEK